MSDEAARAPDHQQHHRETEYQHAILVEPAEQLEAADHGERGKRHAKLRAHAAEHDDCEHQRQFLEGKGFRADKTLPGGEEGAGEAAEHRARRKCRELGRRGVDAERAAGDFILAQRFPGAADGEPAQADRYPVGEQRQRQDQIKQKDDAVGRREFDAESGRQPIVARRQRNAEHGRPRNAADAVRAAGQALPVDDDEADDLAEGERDDGQIIAAQSQHGKAEQHAPEGGEDAGERQADPERQSEIGRQQRVGIGADGIERDIAEVEQAGEADHHVQSPSQHHVSQHENAEIEDVALVVENHRHQKREDRAAQARPGVPPAKAPTAPMAERPCTVPTGPHHCRSNSTRMLPPNTIATMAARSPNRVQ